MKIFQTSFMLIALAGLSACGNKMTAPDCPSADEGTANPAGLRPVVWDDQRTTFLRFPGNQSIPAITATRIDGAERAVNSNADPDTGLVMVHGVYPKLILRDGSRIACIVNNAYDRVGRPETGTR